MVTGPFAIVSVKKTSGSFPTIVYCVVIQPMASLSATRRRSLGRRKSVTVTGTKVALALRIIRGAEFFNPC